MFSLHCSLSLDVSSRWTSEDVVCLHRVHEILAVCWMFRYSDGRQTRPIQRENQSLWSFFGGGELGEFRSESDILMLANFHFVIQISTKQRIIIDICTDLDNVCVCFISVSALDTWTLCLLLTTKFALASPLWKQARSNWKFNTLVKMVSICGRLLILVIWPRSPSKLNEVKSATWRMGV